MENPYNGASDYIPVKEGETYTYSGVDSYWYASYYDSNKNVSSEVPANTQTFTVPSGVAYLRTSIMLTKLDTAQIEKGSTATTYESYSNICPITGYDSGVITVKDNNQITNTYTVAFGQTVYGGYLNVTTGELAITHGYIASYNGETINEPWISSIDEYAPNTSPSTGAEVVYPLTTPTTLAITSQDIPTLLGENNIFSNCGDVEVKYFTEKSDGIAELIKAFM